MSVVRAHRARMLGEAAAQAASTGARVGAAASEYQMQLVRLGVDLRRLKDIQSIERKIALKRALLPDYRPWVEGVLAADTGAADEILTHVMIWSIDTGDFDAALPLAAYVIRHTLILPERFDRTAPTLICEEIAEAALKRLGQDPDPADAWDAPAMLRTLDQVADLVAESDIYDQVRAKLEKALGLALARRAEAIAADADGPAGARRGGLEQALRHLRRALELDDGCGVKTAITRLERELKKEATDG